MMNARHDFKLEPGGAADAAIARGGWVVLKFGGTSVSSRPRWETIAETIGERLGEGCRVLVVCSALSQVSNRIEALLARAARREDPGSGQAALWQNHARLAAALGVDADERLADLRAELSDLLEGVRLTQELTPRLTARVMAIGELASTRLGVQWLRSRGLRACWQDARELLVAQVQPRAQACPERQYLSATCDCAFDPEVEGELRGRARVIVTQGFIARLPSGDGVLLGRGGSDTAAAYLAGKLAARRIEIWTDVPGMFTANPRQVPEARLLRRLGYGEAGELASKGAKVLHPRSIAAARERGIPIHVRCTPRPELPGTVISAEETAAPPQVKAVAARKGMILVSMDVAGDWQQVGLLAEVTGRFADHGLSIDLLASSQTNLVAALDPAANPVDDGSLSALLGELEAISSPRLIRPAASVSLVGTGIREILHEWAPVLRCFEDVDIHLVAQAANDLSLSLVVGEERADRLVADLHRQLFSDVRAAGPFGPTWESLCGEPAAVLTA